MTDAVPVPVPPARRSVKAWLLTGLKVVVSIGLIAFILSNLDIESAFDKLTDVSPFALVIACLLIFLQLAAISMRWTVMIRMLGLLLPARTALRLNMEGLFFNMGLPSVVGGDAIRIYRVRRYGMKTAQSAASVLLDRGYGMVGLLLLALFGLPVSFGYIADPAARFGLLALIGGGLAGFVVFLLLDLLPLAWRRWRVVAGIAGLSGAARRVLKRPKLAVRVLPLSLLGQSLMVGAVYVIAVGLDVSITYIDCLAIVPVVFLISIAPITIGGWGLREQAMVTGFSFLGVPAAEAFATSLLFGLCMMVISLPGGILWLMASRKIDAPATERTE
ncbi:MAG: lysylphosphatidylglycerol synthase transmembrane domain-containing protein [Alphaproteobacteria bacterium]